MDRINRIMTHPIFLDCINQNEMAEVQRDFCHHDMEHLCAVARIAMLLNIEENMGITKDLVYATALLHDCGRFLQYREGIPHDQAGAEIAEKILPQCGYDAEEVQQITQAISFHRGSVSYHGKKSEEMKQDKLAGLIKKADKMSRNCRFCSAYEECNWKEEEKQKPFVW